MILIDCGAAYPPRSFSGGFFEANSGSDSGAGGDRSFRCHWSNRFFRRNHSDKGLYRPDNRPDRKQCQRQQDEKGYRKDPQVDDEISTVQHDHTSSWLCFFGGGHCILSVWSPPPSKSRQCHLGPALCLFLTILISCYAKLVPVGDDIEKKVQDLLQHAVIALFVSSP